MAAATLDRLADDLLEGRIRIVDLTQTLSPDFPALQLPPQFGQVWAFKMEKISHYDEAGPGWYWNNFSLRRTHGHPLRCTGALDHRQGPSEQHASTPSSPGNSSRRRWWSMPAPRSPRTPTGC